jgi:hypothetical protein
VKHPGAGVAIIVALISYAGRSEVPDGKNGARLETTLTASGPTENVRLPQIPSHATALRLPVVSVENPSRQGVTILAELVWGNVKGEQILSTVGGVALYPSDRPGTFNLRLPEDVRKRLGSNGEKGPLTLRLKLQSPVNGRALVEPLKVVIGDVTWR